MDTHESGACNALGRMEDYSRIAHLKMIQAVIARLAQNSFILKGWSVTLATGLLAVALKDKDIYAILAFFPTLVLWGLDAYYLMQERLFRQLHDSVARQPEFPATPYSMSIDGRALTGYGQTALWLKACIGPTVAGLHGAVLFVVCIVLAASRG